MSQKHIAVVQRQFTRTLDAYSKYAVRDTAEVQQERADFARPESADVVLDVACGPGALALALAPRVHFVVGVDLTLPMLLQARDFQAERKILRVSFAQSEAERLPFPDGAFSLVTCQFALHHVRKPEAALREMTRVASSEGRLLIVDTLGPESDEKWEPHNVIERLRDPSHVASWRLTTFLKLFEDLGLEIVRQRVRRTERSFNHWMLRAELRAEDSRYVEARKLLESSIPGDRAGFSAQAQGDDIRMVHHEGMFLLRKMVDVNS